MKLKLNKKYIPAEPMKNDEMFHNGFFVWNISRLIDYIELNKKDIVLEKINVKDYSAFCSINEEHLPTVDITKPVILAEINPGKYNLVDGQHRLVKSYRSDIYNIDAYKLKVEQHINFFISVERYKKFVEYWNEKVKRG
jgi:hypothetical protein